MCDEVSSATTALVTVTSTTARGSDVFSGMSRGAFVVPGSPAAAAATYRRQITPLVVADHKHIPSKQIILLKVPISLLLQSLTRSQRRQTLHPVSPSGEANKTYASCLILAYSSTVHLTSCDIDKSFGFDKTVERTSHVRSASLFTTVSCLPYIKLEETSTHKSAKTHAGLTPAMFLRLVTF